MFMRLLGYPLSIGRPTCNSETLGSSNRTCPCVLRADWSYSRPMDSAQHCKNQAAECHRLMKLAPNEDEAEVLKNLSQSWSRLAGQLDRYQALMREKPRTAQKGGPLSW